MVRKPWKSSLRKLWARFSHGWLSRSNWRASSHSHINTMTGVHCVLRTHHVRDWQWRLQQGRVGTGLNPLILNSAHTMVFDDFGHYVTDCEVYLTDMPKRIHPDGPTIHIAVKTFYPASWNLSGLSSAHKLLYMFYSAGMVCSCCPCDQANQSLANVVFAICFNQEAFVPFIFWTHV